MQMGRIRGEAERVRLEEIVLAPREGLWALGSGLWAPRGLLACFTAQGRKEALQVLRASEAIHTL